MLFATLLDSVLPHRTALSHCLQSAKGAELAAMLSGTAQVLSLPYLMPTVRGCVLQGQR